MNTTIPGIKAVHAIITPTCRANRGGSGAFEEAARRCNDEYMMCVNGNARANFHLALTVERPADEEIAVETVEVPYYVQLDPPILRVEQMRIGNTPDGHKWTATWNSKTGTKIWYEGRPMFAVIAGIEDSRVTPDDPIPQWQKCVTALIETMNHHSDEA